MVNTLIKEPYYSDKRTHIKPARPKKSFTRHDDLSFVSDSIKNGIQNAPRIELSAEASHKGGERSNSLEPYYGKHKRLFSGASGVSDDFNYSYEDYARYEEEAITSDDEEQSVLPPRVLYRQSSRAQYTKPPMYAMDQQVTDHYTDSAEEGNEDSTQVISWRSQVLVPKKVNNRPDILDDPSEEVGGILEKCDNPNVLTNTRSRDLTLRLRAPPMGALRFIDACFDNEPPSIKSRDDYDLQIQPLYYV